jgi:hypothetical protein
VRNILLLQSITMFFDEGTEHHVEVVQEMAC